MQSCRNFQIFPKPTCHMQEPGEKNGSMARATSRTPSAWSTLVRPTSFAPNGGASGATTTGIRDEQSTKAAMNYILQSRDPTDHQPSPMGMIGGASGASMIACGVEENDWRTTSRRTSLQRGQKHRNRVQALAERPLEVSNRYHLLTRDPTDRQVSNGDATGGASGASRNAPALLNETPF